LRERKIVNLIGTVYESQNKKLITNWWVASIDKLASMLAAHNMTVNIMMADYQLDNAKK